jgi:GH24 family phage-related lysozyme (muramidase)
MVQQMQACIAPAQLERITTGEFIAYGHWAYNTGTGAFCHSTLNTRLNAGDHAGACRAMASWTFITVRGRKVNCRTAGPLCPGIPKRRDMEVAMCLGALP